MGETPGPIPNPEAKPHCADGTALDRVWESRSPPNTRLLEAPNCVGGLQCFLVTSVSRIVFNEGTHKWVPFSHLLIIVRPLGRMHVVTTKAELLRVAVGQPAVIDGDHVSSALAHADLIRSARADLMVFPEMSLTGYHLDAADVEVDGDAVALLVDACRSADGCALVGAPVTENGARFIAILRIDGNGVEIAYRKTHLHGDENKWFVPGPGASAIEVLGWRIGLGICKDTGTAEHVHATAALDIDVYACGVVHHRWELAEQQRRAAHISAACGAYVAMASFAGATGEGFRATAGRSAIVSPGQRMLAAAGPLPGDYVTAVLV